MNYIFYKEITIYFFFYLNEYVAHMETKIKIEDYVKDRIY